MYQFSKYQSIKDLGITFKLWHVYSLIIQTLSIITKSLEKQLSILPIGVESKNDSGHRIILLSMR